ncbi:MAG: hypothetical protein NXI32_03185 [bacterium]|nr:hypothetical protein [bacterium]
MKPTRSSWPTRLVASRATQSYFACLFFLLFLGCGQEQESLHDADHYVPPHWPANLMDAAHKMDQRYQGLLDGELDSEDLERNRSELRDLIAWAPEIAADTDLTESQWLPIYELSEKLRKRLEGADTNYADWQSDIDQLRQLLTEAPVSAPGYSDS